MRVTEISKEIEVKGVWGGLEPRGVAEGNESRGIWG